MDILITGASGQLGRELQEALATGHTELGAIPPGYQNCNVIAAGRDMLDISHKESVDAFFAEHDFDIIFNCASMTDVDACETELEQARAANAVGPQLLALALREHTTLVHISTDYVFDGNARTPYLETDIPNPETAYGRSKLEGELFVSNFCTRHFIARTSWLYGRHGSNFVSAIQRLAQEHESIRVVDDQRGNPTYANDLVHALLRLALTDAYGTYHCTGEGVCSRYEFAQAIVEAFHLDCDVAPCTSEEFPRPATRPAYSALDNSRLRARIGKGLRPWREALEAYARSF